MDKYQPQDFAQFFLLTHFDELKSVDHATEAIAIFSRLQKSSAISKKTDQDFVRATFRIWKKYSLKFSHKTPPPILSPEILQRSGGMELNMWGGFLLQLRQEESLTLLWHELFRVSIEDLAEALGVSVGTVKYRLHRALIKLGQLLRKQDGK